MMRLVSLVFTMFVVLSNAFAADAPVQPMQDGIATFNVNNIKEFDPKSILRKGPILADKLAFNAYFLQPRQYFGNSSSKRSIDSV